jgi:hypothetical protein
MSNTSSEINKLLHRVCADNDYVLAFQDQQVVKDLAAETVRLVGLTKKIRKKNGSLLT